MLSRDEVLRKFEINQVRKMVKEIRKNGDNGVSHYLERAERTKDDDLFTLLEDAMDLSAKKG